MRLVFLVDDGATDLCESYNEVANRNGELLKFVPLRTTGQMFAEIPKSTPDLILLHHTWTGISISKILEQLVGACDTTRVIVFTGKRLNTGEIVECVRAGVADYWERDKMTVEFVLQQTTYYCSNQNWQIRALRTSPGSIVHLMAQAEEEAAAKRALEVESQKLTRKIQELSDPIRSAGRKHWRAVGKYAGLIGCLAFIYAATNNLTPVGPAYSLGLVGICALMVLFLDGTLSFAQFSIKNILRAAFRGKQRHSRPSNR